MANILICNAQNGDVITQFPSTELENFIKSRKKDEVFEIQIQEDGFEPIAIGDYVILHENNPPQCPPGQHWDGTQCVPDVIISGTWTSSKWTKVEELPKDQPNKNWIVGGSASGWISTFDNQTVLSHAGTGGPAKFDGNGNCNLTGDQSRMYILAKNYNSVLTLTLVPSFNSNSDDCSLKLRSRHNNGGAAENRFGGYGFAIGPTSWDAKREDYHNVHTQLASGSNPKLENGKPYVIRFTVKDNNGKVEQKAEVNGVEVGRWSDSNPKSYMLDQALYNQESYFWIRNNGSGSINVRDVKLESI